jgi:hypothetical protein
MHLMPKGGEVAEIGVAKGEFSRFILAHAKPRKLHLIDLWAHQTREDYAADGNNADDVEQDRRHQAVLEQFGAEIRDGVVAIHRAYSHEAAAEFADGQLDWVYIDALHSYDGVLSDLRNYKDKVKSDGLILGHDYTNNVRAQQMQFGVVEAVNDFVEQEGFKFVTLTHELFPTYVLARNLESNAVRNLMAQLLVCVPGVIEIRDYPDAGIFQHKVVKIAGNIRNLLSF